LAIAEFRYRPGHVERGYNSRTLYVNLSDMKIESKPVSEEETIGFAHL
jgi:aldehyde:ferredoxin oxidoreductase